MQAGGTDSAGSATDRRTAASDPGSPTKQAQHRAPRSVAARSSTVWHGGWTETDCGRLTPPRRATPVGGRGECGRRRDTVSRERERWRPCSCSALAGSMTGGSVTRIPLAGFGVLRVVGMCDTRPPTTAVQPLSCSASWKKCRVVARMLLLILPLQKSTKNSSRARENSAFASSSTFSQPF